MIAATQPHSVTGTPSKTPEVMELGLSGGSLSDKLDWAKENLGKSTIINQIAGETLRKTGEVREVDLRGRHTTTWSELLVLNCGSQFLLIHLLQCCNRLQLFEAFLSQL